MTHENLAEVLSGLRHLRQDPSPEAAQSLLEDWAAQGEVYDQTDSAWRPTQCSGTP